MADQAHVDTRRLADLELDQASGAWGFAFLIQAVMVCLSLFFAFSSGVYIWAPVITALLAVASTTSRWLAERHKEMAEGLRRTTEEHDCFGWPCSGALRADLLAAATPALLTKAEAPDRLDPCHTVQNPLPPGQVMELVEQSAWWTRRLTSELGYLVAGFAAVASSVALITLLAALQDVASDPSAGVPKLALSIVVLISCSGLIRLAADHYAASAGALRIRMLAATLRAQGSASRVNAIRLLHQFQALRQQAPLVPSFWVQVRREGLSREWQEERLAAQTPAIGH